MEKFEEFAKQMAEDAKVIIKENFHLGMKKKWKSDNTPVTEVDLAVNKLLLERVSKGFPEHSVLAEEESNVLEKSEFTWVCDPVDGTIPFSSGVPMFTFSLALVQNGEPILGIVVDPVLDRTFFASKGKGCFLNGEKVSVSDSKGFDRQMIAVEGGGGNDEYDSWDIMSKIRQKGSRVCRFNSVVYTGVLVAAGEFLGSIFLYSSAHDIAALKIIVEEAGGKVTNLLGAEQKYDGKINGAIITNGLIHDDLVDLIEKLKK